MKTLKDLLEASILDIEGTLIDSDNLIKSPKIALGVKCNNIEEVADAVGRCVGKKIKVKKLKIE